VRLQASASAAPWRSQPKEPIQQRRAKTAAAWRSQPKEPIQQRQVNAAAPSRCMPHPNAAAASSRYERQSDITAIMRPSGRVQICLRELASSQTQAGHYAPFRTCPNRPMRTRK